MYICKPLRETTEAIGTCIHGGLEVGNDNACELEGVVVAVVVVVMVSYNMYSKEGVGETCRQDGICALVVMVAVATVMDMGVGVEVVYDATKTVVIYVYGKEGEEMDR